MEAKTASETKGHYDPLPAQIITVDGKKYGYEFDKLSFAQAMLAQERAILRIDRIEYLSNNKMILERECDPDYLKDMAGILFVPIEGRKFAPFDKDSKDEVADIIANKGNASTILIIENCINDFFRRIGRRSIGYESLWEEKKLSMSIRQMRNMMGSLNPSTKESNYSTQTNSSVDIQSDLTAGQ